MSLTSEVELAAITFASGTSTNNNEDASKLEKALAQIAELEMQKNSLEEINNRRIEQLARNPAAWLPGWQLGELEN